MSCLLSMQMPDNTRRDSSDFMFPNGDFVKVMTKKRERAVFCVHFFSLLNITASQFVRGKTCRHNTQICFFFPVSCHSHSKLLTTPITVVLNYLYLFIY